MKDYSIVRFSCLGTGSSGNCYLLNVGSSNLLLDAGIKIEKITKAINLNLVDFAFISHTHKDHSLSEEKLHLRGVPVLRGELVDDFIKIKKSMDIIEPMNIYAFPVEHGDCKNAGLIIKTRNECILYITDFTVCKYDLSIFKFTSVIVECNYLKEKVTDTDLFNRTKENIYRHMSLDGTDLFLSKLDLSNCNEIILTHFSNDFSDAIYMGSYINNMYKIKTLCCKRFGGYDIYE